MYSQSGSYPEMIDLVRRLKEKYGSRIATVSNEGKELTVYRIQKYHLTSLLISLYPHVLFITANRTVISTAWL